MERPVYIGWVAAVALAGLVPALPLLLHDCALLDVVTVDDFGGVRQLVGLDRLLTALD